MFILDTLDNMPRQQISTSLMKVILWTLRECGAYNVPSFDRLRTVQKGLAHSGGIPTVKHESCKGNVFYYNDPRAIIARVRPNSLLLAESSSC